MDYIIAHLGREALRPIRIGLLPCGIVSTPSPKTELGSVLPETGFTEFTSFFDLSFLRKLRNARVYFTVTIRAYQDTLIDFLFYLLPRSGQSANGETKIFCLRIPMMKIESVRTALITANHAFSAFIFTGHFSKFLAPLRNSFS